MGITPSEFFDYAPFIFYYSSYMPESRKEVMINPAGYEKYLHSLGNSEERIKYFLNDALDIFGESRYVIEIIVKKEQKQYKYLMSIDIFQAGTIDESNASKDFDIEVLLMDEYGGKSFVREIYNNVSISFQTQIKTEFYNLTYSKIDEDISNYATLQKKKLKVFLQTPFGDINFSIGPSKININELENKYGADLVNNWKL